MEHSNDESCNRFLRIGSAIAVGKRETRTLLIIMLAKQIRWIVIASVIMLPEILTHL